MGCRSVMRALMQTNFHSDRIKRRSGEFLSGVDRTRANSRRYFDIGECVDSNANCPKCWELLDRYVQRLFRRHRLSRAPIGSVLIVPSTPKDRAGRTRATGLGGAIRSHGQRGFSFSSAGELAMPQYA